MPPIECVIQSFNPAPVPRALESDPYALERGSTTGSMKGTMIPRSLMGGILLYLHALYFHPLRRVIPKASLAEESAFASSFKRRLRL